MNKDYYRILGVNKNSTLEEIKKSYRELIKENHPDNNKNADLKYISMLNEAYNILSNEESRKEYDSIYDQIKDNNSESSSMSVDDLYEKYKKTAKRSVLKNIVNEELIIVNKLIDDKNQFINDALSDIYTHKEYYNKVKLLIINFEKEFQNFCEIIIKLEEENFYDEIERVEGIKYFIKEVINELSLDLEDLKRKKELQDLNKEFSNSINSKFNSFNDSLKELFDFSAQIYLGNISKTEVSKLYQILVLSIQDEISTFNTLNHIYKEYDLEETQNINKFKELVDYVKNNLLNLEYEEINKLGKSIYNFNNCKENYEEWVNVKSKKIEKIKNILYKYPNNKKSMILFNYVTELYENQINYLNKFLDIDLDFYGLYSTCPLLNESEMFYLKYNLNDYYEEFIASYAPIDIIEKRPLSKKFLTDLKEFRNVKTYGDYIKKYKLFRKFIKVDDIVTILYILNQLKELKLEKITSNEIHYHHLKLEFLLAIPVFAVIFASRDLLKNWTKNMKEEIDYDSILKRIYDNKK